MGVTRRRVAFAAAGAGVLAAAAAHVWARHIEIHMFKVREVNLPILPADSPPIRVLHMSDAHMIPSQDRKRRFLRWLDSLEPDFVVNTGDNVGNEEAICSLVSDLAMLVRRPGVFVLGSNDKFAASKRNIFRYLLRDPRPRGYRSTYEKAELPVAALKEGLASGGWVDLTNTRATVRVRGIDIECVGVDDPHLDHDRFPAPTRAVTDDNDPPRIKIGVTHAPYARVLDQFVADGCQLIMAGHTHGGQLAVPGIGALVTNCDLHRSQAKGLSFHAGVPLHVSGGIGASPYYNMRVANPPEVTILTLSAGRR